MTEKVNKLGWDVVEIIDPAPDGQYRLTSCDCGSRDVVYVRFVSPYCYNKPIENPPRPSPHDMWRVSCRACGKTVNIFTTIRHNAQLAWNRR